MIRKSVLVLFAILSGAQAMAQEGKVLSLVGDVTVTRKNATGRLENNAPVFLGDRINVGEKSLVQIRMSDQTVLALKEKSAIEISKYAFVKGGDDSNALFKLIKGGMRVVTGIIGRESPKNFAVDTVVATIGIRGTHFRLHLCDADPRVSDCRDGEQTAPAGLYGGVSEGRIGVVNSAGDSEFGVDEYFFVASSSVLPERLMLPPRMLTDRTAFLSRLRGATAVATPVVGSIGDNLARPMALDADPGLAGVRQASLLGTQFRAIEASLSPTSLAHSQVVAPPVSGGFIDVGGSGVIRGQAIWLTDADIDLHMTAPTGGVVSYSNRTVTLNSTATAQLDHDNLGGVIDASPNQRIENITVTGTNIPGGAYSFRVNSFSGNNGGQPTTVQLRVTGDSNATSLTDNVSLANQQTSGNYVVNYAPGQAPIYSKP